MAIIPESQYPGKITPASAEYPYGQARNITLPGDGTGTPWEAALVNDLFGFQQALLSEAEITPSGDPETATASQYLEALKKLLGVPGEAVLSADLNAIDTSGGFYANGSTLNRPAGLVGTVDSLVIDADTATQRFVATTDARAFFRAKNNGVWAVWYEISAQEILTEGWPTIIGDNEYDEIPTDTTAGWTSGANTTLTVINGDTLNMTSSSNTDAINKQTIAQTADGDWIAYMTLSTDIQTEYATVDLAQSDTGGTPVAFGVVMNYDWSTLGQENGRISALIGSAENTITGPIVDTTQPTDIAVYYNDEFEAVTLFVKQAGEWIGYGPVTLPRTEAYWDVLRTYVGNAQLAVNLQIHELFFAKPNVVSIGDSITKGATLYAPDPAEALTDYSSCWQRYANLYPLLRNNIIVNKGIGSQSSAQIDARLPNVLADTQAQVVFLQASANDFALSISQSQRTANIQASVDKITAAGAKAALINSVYANADSGASFPAAADYMRDWWQNERVNITGATIKIDWMATSGILDGDYMDTVFTQADGIHPTPAGYELLGDYIQSLEPTP